MPIYVVSKVTDALNDDAKSVKNANVLILGVAYKRDVDDVRESPALDIISLLEQKGARVQFHDPHVASVRLEDNRVMHTSEYSAALVAAADCVVIVTDHSAYDWAHVISNAKLVVDTRHATHGKTNGGARIVSL